MKLTAIEMDNTIQCRAAIDVAVVNDYAERMTAGVRFPAITVFGTRAKCWIGDGWHRVQAAQQVGADSIEAKVSPGGRVDALKFALGANALHGNPRTNADKRRAVEIALREFPKLSSRQVARLCGVSDPFVNSLRPALQTVSNATVTTADGRQYPAKREPRVAGHGPFVSAKDDPDSPDYVPRHVEAQAIEMANAQLATEAERHGNPHLRKQPVADGATQVTRAIQAMETMTEVLIGFDHAHGAEHRADWAARLRKCRTAVSRFIAQCEEVR